MSRALRTSLAGGGIAAVLTAGGIALASAQGGSPGSKHQEPQLSERRILRIAEKAAADAGDPHPGLIQHSEGARHQANLVDSGEGVTGRRWSYLIAERGHFVVRDSEGLQGSAVPRGSVLTLIVNASTGDVTDFGVSNHYPDLAKLGPVHTDLRRTPGHHRTTHRTVAAPRSNYGVEIQATYDRSGNPELVANFDPNGSLATPRWAICSPACRAVKSRSPLAGPFEPGPTPSGTVFQASATYEGRTYTAPTAVWTGQVHATGPPLLDGQPRAGARVAPRRAAWRGGWKALPGYRPARGMFSGGREPSVESLSVEACRTATGEHCVNLTPQGKRLDFAQHPITVPRQFTGWYLFAFDEHLPPDMAWADPAYATFAIPPLKVGATIARSAPLGPVRG